MIICFLVDQLDRGFYEWFGPAHGTFFNTLLKELRDKIWELKENSNVTTKEEFQSTAFDRDMC